MKVTVATSKSDLSLLTKLDEPIVVYANDKTIYHKISKIRNSIEHITIVIYDKDRKTPNQVILEHRDRLKIDGSSFAWVKKSDSGKMGLPKPVKEIINNYL